jgi:Acyl-CoA reductase (LuxC)
VADFTAGIVIRGEYIEDNLVEVGGRGGGASFLLPDPQVYADRLTLGSSTRLAELYDLSFDDLLDYLVELGTLLDVNKNEHLAQAREASYRTSPVTPPIVDWNYEMVPLFFKRDILRQMMEEPLGSIDYLEGWVPRTLISGEEVEIRAFGSRSVHIIAGNHPVPGILSVVRNALTRGDAIIKLPSNDPLFSLAIARTMCEMAPHHPITKHLTVAYWKGGDTEVEKKIYNPAVIEKIVAWGGFNSIKHVARYMQPGLELISLDPKRSASVIGKEAFESEESMRDAAQRVACDIGAENQAGCVNARIVYVASGTDGAGLVKLNKLGQYAYDALMTLPEHLSTKPKGGINVELRKRLDNLRMDDEWYRVIGGQDEEGAIVCSQLPDPVDFWDLLNDRVANFVPIDTIDDALQYFDAYTQTVGIYPDSLKEQLKDIVPLFGAQRLVSLGYAGGAGLSFATPQDAIEPVRRMVKWIVHEKPGDPSIIPPLWET